ncbi:MAG: hypothetical protein WCJ04_09855 [Actinomycetes bacterium]
MQPELTDYRVPAGNWSVASFSYSKPGISSTSSLRLVIARPDLTTANKFQVVGLSDMVTTGPGTISVANFTLPTPIPVQEGDVLAMVSGVGAVCLLNVAGAPSHYLNVPATLAVGSSIIPNGQFSGSYSLNIAAQLVSR